MSRHEATTQVLRLLGGWAVNVLALIGALAAGWWTLSTTLKPPGASHPDFLESIRSPDGRHKALRASWEGGLAISPSCYDRIYLVPADLPDDQALSDGFLIAAAECGSFSSEQGKVRRSPSIEWQSSARLLVAISLNEVAKMPVRVELRKPAPWLDVKVQFAAHE